MTPTQVAAGALLEARVARLLHAEGAFVRTSVDLNAQFRERFGITDIDVFAVSFDSTLTARVMNGECKTTESKSAPSSGDRLLWLAGVAQLIDAERCFLVTTKSASDDARALSARLGSEILDPRDLARREERVKLEPSTPYGTHGQELLALRLEVQKTIQPDRDLQRVYWFVRSEVWLALPTVALKRAIAACRVLGGRYAESLPDKDRVAVAWLAAEVVTGFVLALTRIAGQAYRQPEDVFERQFNEALAEGLASYAALRETSKAIDKYVVGLLGRYGIDPARSAEAIGAFEPRPPSYAEPLTELVQRVAMSARAAADLPRLAEHYMLGSLRPSVLLADVPAVHEAETARLLRVVATFLEAQAQMPAALLRPLRERVDERFDADGHAAASGSAIVDRDRRAAHVDARGEHKLFTDTGKTAGS